MSISRQFSQNLLSIYNQIYNLSQILAFTYLSGIYPTASTGTRSTQYLAEEGDKEDVELPLFELKTIIQATDNFSRDNKLGEGGFGPVYKVNIYYSRVKFNPLLKVLKSRGTGPVLISIFKSMYFS